MSQSHLVIDFPVKGPANAKALPGELPPLMPDLASQRRTISVPCISPGSWSWETRSLSSSRTSTARPTSTLSGSWRAPVRCLTLSSTYVDDPPATPVADNPEGVIRWLKRHVREPVDTYFACDDASVQDIKACARAAGFTGNTSQAHLADIHCPSSRVCKALFVKLVAGAVLVRDRDT